MDGCQRIYSSSIWREERKGTTTKNLVLKIYKIYCIIHKYAVWNFENN